MHDAAGTLIEPAHDARILSLVPSLTELVFDLGLGSRLVGRTAFCVHPAGQVNALESVGGTKRLNMTKVEAVRPTHALMNIDENPKSMAEDLIAMGIQPIVSHPQEVTDNRELYRLMGHAFGVETKAGALTDAFDDALARLPAPGGTQRVLYVIWKSPWMTITPPTYIARMLSRIGWRHVEIGDGARYPEFGFSDTLLENIDRILFSTEPFTFKEKHLTEFAAAFPRHAHKARLVDGELLSWYGSRAIRGLGYLGELAASR